MAEIVASYLANTNKIDHSLKYICCCYKNLLTRQMLTSGEKKTSIKLTRAFPEGFEGVYANLYFDSRDFIFILRSVVMPLAMAFDVLSIDYLFKMLLGIYIVA